MEYIYTGSSWADTSFPLDAPTTNLAKQWRIPFVPATRQGSSVLENFEYIKNLKSNLPIVWIYNEPLVDLKSITGLDYVDFLTRQDWLDIWHDCNLQCLKSIASLGVPVLLIGGHSDVVNCDYDNIIVGDSSWQRYLAQLAGMSIDESTIHVKMNDGGNFVVNRCWGADTVHREIHMHPEIDPDSQLINSIWDMFFFWQQLEQAELFYQVHPNHVGNTKFAEYLLPTVKKFIKDIK